jgi:hypothetical protein
VGAALAAHKLGLISAMQVGRVARSAQKELCAITFAHVPDARVRYQELADDIDRAALEVFWRGRPLHNHTIHEEPSL